MSPLLLGERGIDVPQEWIRVGPELGHDERHPVLHQPGDVVDVAAQPVELGTDDRGLGLARPLDRRVQLRPVIVSAALRLGEGLDQIERLGLGKPGDCRALRLEAEPRAPLPRRRESDVADCFPHHRFVCK
jgi:hypothetical protein